MSNTNPSTAAEAPKTPLPEITLRVIVLGIILSVVMGAANVYVGLKAGMTVSASIPAAVMSMLLFRYLFRKPNILEANQVQTCASAGEALTAVGIAGLAAWGIQALDFNLSSGTVTLLTGLAAIAIVVAFSLFTRPQKNR